MKLIYKGLHGSALYGTNTEQSDTDYKGVFIETLENIILRKDEESVGLGTKSSGNHEKNTKNDVDFTCFELRNSLRNCATVTAQQKELTPSSLSANQSVLPFGIQQCLSKRFPFLIIDDVSLLTNIRLSPEIQKSIDEQFTAQQAAKTAESNTRKITAEALAKVAQAKGEAQVTIENAKATAEANKLTAGSITPNLIQMRKLDIELARINKWNGVQGTVIQTPNTQLANSPEQK